MQAQDAGLIVASLARMVLAGIVGAELGSMARLLSLCLPTLTITGQFQDV